MWCFSLRRWLLQEVQSEHDQNVKKKFLEATVKADIILNKLKSITSVN